MCKEHNQVINLMKRTGLKTHIALGSYLASLLIELGKIQYGLKVFDSLAHQNELSWNTLIHGYIKCGMPHHALTLFHDLYRDESVHLLNEHSFVDLLRACAKMKDLKGGLSIHIRVASMGFLETNPFIGSSLVDMYGKCYSLSKAQQVFNKISFHDAVTWTALIGGYVENGSNEEALTCFEKMMIEGIFPNVITYGCTLKACANIGLEALGKGKFIHAEIERTGFLKTNLMLGNALVNMYAKMGALNLAQEVLGQLSIQDVVSMTSLIAGYVENGYDDEALDCFQKMQIEGLTPDAVTLVCCLKACGNIGDLEKGQIIHAELARGGLLESKNVGNALICMYVKLGSLSKAIETLKNIAIQNVVSWNTLIYGCAEGGYGEEALRCFKQMEQEGYLPDVVTLVSALKACSSIGAMHEGQKMHIEIEKVGLLDENQDVGTMLVDMYVKCGLLLTALKVFDKLTVRGVVPWTAIISGYVKYGYDMEALKLYQKMQVEHISPNTVTYIFVLKACSRTGAVQKGQQIHINIEIRGLLETDMAIGNSLVGMYANLGCFTIAQHVFDTLQVRDEVSWVTLISGFVENGYADMGLIYFKKMQIEGVAPNAVTFIYGLKACGLIGALDTLKELYIVIEREGLLEREINVGNTLVYAYAKCGCLLEACDVFNKLPIRNVVTWNTLIAGCVEQEDGEQAIKCFENMHLLGVYPNAVTYIHCLKACISIYNADKGQEIHIEIEKKGFIERDFQLCSSLIDMYAKYGWLAEAQKVFDKLPVKDVVVWTSLIAGYSSYGYSKEVLECLMRMLLQGIIPNTLTFLASLEACGSIGNVEKGQNIYSLIETLGLLHTDLIIGNAVISMFIKCDYLLEAVYIFEKLPVHDVVSWTTVIAGYTGYGYNQEALEYFERMKLEGVSLNSVTFLCCLKACNSVHTMGKGQELHFEIQRQGLLTRNLTVGNSLIGMYAKSGCLTMAEQVFNELLARDMVSWTSLILGYTGHGNHDVALKRLEKMQLEGFPLNAPSFICCLKVCGNIGALDKLYVIHSQIEKQGFLQRNCVIGNSLVNVYAKLGFLAKAQAVFDMLPVQDLVSWNTLIVGYSKLGETKNVFSIFDRMRERCIKPDSVTFIAILSVCSRTGYYLDKSLTCFEAMSKEYGIKPSFDHCVWMINLLGCVGELDKVMEVARRMPYGPHLVVWHAVLSASRRWGSLEHGELAFKQAMHVDETIARASVLRTHIGGTNVTRGGTLSREMNIFGKACICG